MGGKIMKELGQAVVTGGMPRVKYYAPDGTSEELIPAHRERQDGVVYDVLLAQGYSLTPPENPKPHCDGCNRWHNTQEEVDTCVKERKASAEYWERKARKDLNSETNTEVTELKDKVDRIEGLLEKLLIKLE